MKLFAQNWLDIQCLSISNIHSALFLLLDTDEKKLKPAAHWPSTDSKPIELMAIARLAAENKENIINPNVTVDNQVFDYLASPIYAGKQLLGIVAVKTKHQNNEQQQQVLQSLAVGSKWLALPSGSTSTDTFYMTAVRLAVNCLEQDTVKKAYTVLISDLAQQFSCERVSLGEIRGHHSRVVALSNSASFDDKSNLINSISAAMDEAIAQDQVTVYPVLDQEFISISIAHADLAKKYGCGSICTIPLIHDGQVLAVLTLERNEEQPFDQDALDICEQTLALISPYLLLKKKDERGVIKKSGSSVKQALANLFGFNNLGLKLVSFAAVITIAFGAMVEDDFRVNADAVLEGKIQRTISSPLTGFINSANVRAGDEVSKGEVLATLEDADIKLERIKLLSQLQQLQREHREALAGNNLVQVRILSSKMAQLDAQIDLNNEQLERTQLKVPFDGVVIEGDLSQSLGAPVEKGDSLFKIAPLDDYRVILKVSERSISYIHSKQIGTLVLSSMPNEKFQLQVKKITQVAIAEDGSNIFRVEASLPGSPKLLRPGMEGIGKIEIGQEKLLWIWTHELVDWLKLWVWSWMP